jgi:hypothetical protein
MMMIVCTHDTTIGFNVYELLYDYQNLLSKRLEMNDSWLFVGLGGQSCLIFVYFATTRLSRAKSIETKV